MPGVFHLSQSILDWLKSQVDISTLPPQVRELLEGWLQGEKDPTFKQIETVSQATGIPFGYFFLKDAPKEDLSFVHYRSVASTESELPSRNLIEVMHQMRQIQDWARNNLIEAGEEPLTYVGKFKDERNPLIIVQALREFIGLDADWYEHVQDANESFNFVRAAVSSAGLIVMLGGIVGNNMRRVLFIDEVRAFSLVDEYAPLIFINTNDSLHGQLFALLHELANIGVGANSWFNDRSYTLKAGNEQETQETLCKRVAAEMLVPSWAFLERWNVVGNTFEPEPERKLELLAKYFHCSLVVSAMKAHDNHLIGCDLYCNIAHEAVQQSKQRQAELNKHGTVEGDSYQSLRNNFDRRFLNMLLSSVHEGKTMYSDAFRLTNTNHATFDKLVNGE